MVLGYLGCVGTDTTTGDDHNGRLVRALSQKALTVALEVWGHMSATSRVLFVAITVTLIVLSCPRCKGFMSTEHICRGSEDAFVGLASMILPPRPINATYGDIR